MPEGEQGAAGAENGEQNGQQQQESGQESGEQQNGQQGTEQQQAGDESKQVKDLRNESAGYRTQLRAVEQKLADAQAASQAQLDGIAKALGLKGDEANDPAKQVTDLTGQVGTLTEHTAQLEAELLVHTLAPEQNGNAVALLDSRAFATKLHGLDPAAEDYRAKVAAAIKEAVDASPTLRAVQATSAGGTDNAGQGAGGNAPVTQERFNDMSYAERTALFHTDPTLYRRLNGSA